MCWVTFSQMPCQRPEGTGGASSVAPASTAVTLSVSCSPKKCSRVRTCTHIPESASASEHTTNDYIMHTTRPSSPASQSLAREVVGAGMGRYKMLYAEKL